MPWKRKGKCVFKITKNKKIGKKQGCSDSVEKAKKYLKALYANADDVSEAQDFGEFVVNTVNEVISSLPYGHEYRNDTFARSILEKISQKLKK